MKEGSVGCRCGEVAIHVGGVASAVICVLFSDPTRLPARLPVHHRTGLPGLPACPSHNKLEDLWDLWKEKMKSVPASYASGEWGERGESVDELGGERAAVECVIYDSALDIGAEAAAKEMLGQTLPSLEMYLQAMWLLEDVVSLGESLGKAGGAAGGSVAGGEAAGGAVAAVVAVVAVAVGGSAGEGEGGAGDDNGGNASMLSPRHGHVVRDLQARFSKAVLRLRGKG